MNVFIAGVHGVGKTFLASQIPARLGLTHISASKLIKEERALPNWEIDKRVSDVDANQIALAAAVARHNTAGTHLLLDGHFVLLNIKGQFSPLEAHIFKTLNLKGVVLLEAAPQIIAARIRERDGRDSDIEHIVKFLLAERTQAHKVCGELGVSLQVLEEPNPEVFAKIIERII